MLRRRRWLWLCGALALCPLAAAGYLHVRHRLDFGSAIAKALRRPERYFVDRDRLAAGPFTRAPKLGTLENRLADEISGLALSSLRPDLLFGVNDSGDGPVLYAFGDDGRDRGTVRVRGAENVDWEALDSFVLDGVAYLLIADVGDNLSWRPAFTLYVVREPELRGERFPAKSEVEPIYVLRARYADGPEDCEAVAVDADAQRVLLLSKRAVPPVLYSLPLVLRKDDPEALDDLLVARAVARATGLPQARQGDLEADPSFVDMNARPTSLALSADGRSAIVLTYREAYLFERSEGEAWAGALARPPRRVALPKLPLMEATAWSRDGDTLYVTSDVSPTPWLRLTR